MYNEAMRGGLERYFIPVCVGFAPVLLLLLSWSPEGQLSAGPRFLKAWSVPVLLVEIFTIVVAMRDRLLARVSWSPSPALLTAALLLVIALADAAFVAPNMVEAWMRTIVLIVHALYGLSIMHLCGRAFAARDLVDALLTGFAFFVTLLALFTLQIPPDLDFDWIGGLPAASNIRHLGYYAAATLGLCFGRLALEGRRSSWCLVVGVATLAFAFSFWSGARGAVIAAAAAFLAAILFLPAMRTRRVAAGALASALIGAAIAYPLPVPEGHMGLLRTVEASTGAQQGGITSGRTELWQTSFSAFLQRPLFGHGEGQMSAVAPMNNLAQPHNVLLQVLLAWGIVGALCLLVLFVPFALRVARSARAAGGEILPPVMAALVLLLYSMIDGTLYHVFSLSVFAACCGLAARMAGKSVGPEPPTRPSS